jgi:hypothetical protein
MDAARLRRCSLIVGAIVLATACGGKDNPSPAGPSPNEPNAQAPAPAPSSGATISGTVSGGSVGQVSAMGVGLSGLTVTVEGTDLRSTTGSSGAFELRGVPAGRVRLRFQGSGASGSLELSDVGQTERIALNVVVNGSTVELESQERVTGSQAQLEGKVTSVNKGARKLGVGATTVAVPEGIPITKGNRALDLSDLIVGARIHAKGTRAGDTFTATSVIVQQNGVDNGDDDDDEGEGGGGGGGEKSVEVSGAISQLAGSCPARSFHVGDREVRTTGATDFKTPCATLSNGQTVTVKGKATGNGKVNAALVQ